jgi:PAS domain S-box-containing protein
MHTSEPYVGGAAELFAGPGEMAARCRALDWSSTPLGPVEQWSQSLRTMSAAVLASRNPMLLFWGPDLVQIYNDAFRPSLGVSTGPAARHPRALGMRAAEFWTDVWAVVGPQIDGVMTRGEAVWFENLHLPIERDGRLDDAWWTYSYSPVRDDEGRIGGTLVVCLETTAAVRAHTELEAERARSAGILEAMADAHFALDKDFRIISVNETMVRNVNLARETMLGRSVWDVFPGLIGSPFERAYRRAATEREESHLTHSYGDRRLELVAEVDAYPTPDGGVAIFWRDITGRQRATAERERARAEAEAARAEAEAANRAKAAFLAMMSHELRTPLNAIGGYAQLMLAGIPVPVTEVQQNYLDRIVKSQQHLLGLIDAVLAHAKLESGKETYRIGDVTVREVLEVVDPLTAPQRAAKRLQYDTSECDLTLVFRADKEKVVQILLNVLSNAAKFTPANGRIIVTTDLPSDGVGAVAVRDTGIGMTAEQLERVFEPFVQFDSSLARESKGIGLGMPISRELARGMGGDLIVSSESGAGSTFTLLVPLAAPPAAAHFEGA